MSQQGSDQHLSELLRPVVEEAGLYLEEVQVRGAGATRVVQVLVDLPEGSTDGVDLEDIARVSQAISQALDEHDAVDGPAYELEVSSPGAARELTLLRHWKRSVGRHVRVTPMEGGNSGKFTAQLLAVEPTSAGESVVTGEAIGEASESPDSGEATVTLQRSEQVKKGMPVKLLEPETWKLSQIRRAKVEVQD
ncbi:ribosome maturation factor RimP [Kocuria sp.]|uniref:ribosome maturation factor RimP n=1 Tax=Kocuria sp. TaxID=1871328 RepID=UPI0026E03B52|nr:ribosome maturation factor RimP [Kocuria sp.]MDO5618776.1 ribosome maturation factor RimP [Kocuria sp.]